MVPRTTTIMGPSRRDAPGERDKTIRTRFRSHLIVLTSRISNLAPGTKQQCTVGDTTVHSKQQCTVDDTTVHSNDDTIDANNRPTRLNGLRDIRTRLGIYFDVRISSSFAWNLPSISVDNVRAVSSRNL